VKPKTDAPLLGGRKRTEKPFINKSLAHSFAGVAHTEKRLAVISRARHDAQRTALLRHRFTAIDNQILNHLFHSSQINQGEKAFGKINLNLMLVTRRLDTNRDYSSQHWNQVRRLRPLVFAAQRSHRIAQT